MNAGSAGAPGAIREPRFLGVRELVEVAPRARSPQGRGVALATDATSPRTRQALLAGVPGGAVALVAETLVVRAHTLHAASAAALDALPGAIG